VGSWCGAQTVSKQHQSMNLEWCNNLAAQQIQCYWQEHEAGVQSCGSNSRCWAGTSSASCRTLQHGPGVNRDCLVKLTDDPNTCFNEGTLCRSRSTS
jgi:hypothetical protein